MKPLLKSLIWVALGAGMVTPALATTGWLTDYNQAVKLSKKTGKPILADFTGSDWCGWCIKLNKEVFSTSEFKKWAAKKVILLELDFPNQKPQSEALKKQNKGLQEKYKIEGYPTILFLSPKGTKLGESGYEAGGPSVWTKNADKILAAAKQTVSKTQTLNGNAYEPVNGEDLPVVKKTLYATNDLRGKQSPKFGVETWLTDQSAFKPKGKVLLIDFWATWCGPCRALIPELNEFAKKYKDDVVIVGVSDESAATVREFMKITPMNYNVAIDTKKSMSKVVGVQGIPHVLVITSDGVVRYQGFPLQDEDRLDAAKLEKIIAINKSLKK